MNYCASCKHYQHQADVAHQMVCVKFRNEKDEPIPCVAARGDEEKCGGSGKAFEE
jgi:hypothetical protein